MQISKFLAALGLVGCATGRGRHSAPAAPTAPAETPEPVLCWLNPSLGSHARLTVDLRLRSGNENREPTRADVDAVAAAGGRVVYSFHVALLRADVDTAALRTLLNGRSGIADVAYPVADTARHDVRVQIFLQRTMTPKVDSTLTALGARDFLRAPRSRNVSATLPDSLVPVVGGLPDVTLIRAQSMFCAAAG